MNKQIFANIYMKMNSKLGGINHELAKVCRPKMLRKPVMIMEADASHPAPECRGLKPSIAAVVGSVEPRAVNYEVHEKCFKVFPVEVLRKEQCEDGSLREDFDVQNWL